MDSDFCRIVNNNNSSFGQCSYVGNSVNETPTKDTLYSYHANNPITGTVNGRAVHYTSANASPTGGYKYNGCEYVKAGLTINIPASSGGQFIFKSISQ